MIFGFAFPIVGAFLSWEGHRRVSVSSRVAGVFLGVLGISLYILGWLVL